MLKFNELIVNQQTAILLISKLTLFLIILKVSLLLTNWTHHRLNSNFSNNKMIKSWVFLIQIWLFIFSQIEIYYFPFSIPASANNLVTLTILSIFGFLMYLSFLFSNLFFIQELRKLIFAGICLTTWFIFTKTIILQFITNSEKNLSAIIFALVLTLSFLYSTYKMIDKRFYVFSLLLKNLLLKFFQVELQAHHLVNINGKTVNFREQLWVIILTSRYLADNVLYFDNSTDLQYFIKNVIDAPVVLIRTEGETLIYYFIAQYSQEQYNCNKLVKHVINGWERQLNE